eukprot:834675-Ditylum_brightwellii.AAC.1
MTRIPIKKPIAASECVACFKSQVMFSKTWQGGMQPQSITQVLAKHVGLVLGGNVTGLREYISRGPNVGPG